MTEEKEIIYSEVYYPLRHAIYFPVGDEIDDFMDEMVKFHQDHKNLITSWANDMIQVPGLTSATVKSADLVVSGRSEAFPQVLRRIRGIFKKIIQLKVSLDLSRFGAAGRPPKRKTMRRIKEMSRVKLVWAQHDWFVHYHPRRSPRFASAVSAMVKHTDNCRYGALVMNLEGEAELRIFIRQRKYTFRLQGKQMYFLRRGVIHEVLTTSPGRVVMIYLA